MRVPGSPEWEARVKQLLAEELTQPERLFYFSFAGEEGFRGAIITRAHGPTDGMVKIHAKKLSPGGQVLVVPVPAIATVPDEALDRLLCEEDVKLLFDLYDQEGKID